MGLHEDWLRLDQRIETGTGEIETISQNEANCQRLMSIPDVGPRISTAVAAAERGWDWCRCWKSVV
jgi:transposase